MNELRLLYNQAIVDKLQELIKKYPDWRFGQILRNCDIIKEICIEEKDDVAYQTVVWKDEFNTESKIIWKRMCNNKFCFSNE